MSDPVDPLRPTAGARFVLELEPGTDEPARASYRAAVITPETRADYAAALDDGGGVALTPRGARASTEHEEMLAMIAKLVARGAGGRKADGLPPWPARITRWRGPGRGS